MPLSTHLDAVALPRSGITIGGLGTGGFELWPDGTCRTWHTFNNFSLGTGPVMPFQENSIFFFVVRYEVEGEHPRLKLLQIESGYVVAGVQHHVYEFPWLTGADHIDATYDFPFTRLRITDDEMPLVIDIEAFSPFIPHDIKDSALPAAIFNCTVTSTSDRPVKITLMASARHCAGYDTPQKLFTSEWQSMSVGQVVQFGVTGMDEQASSWGTQALALIGDATPGYYLGWGHRHPYYETILRSAAMPTVDELAQRNRPDRTTGLVTADGHAYSTVGSATVLDPGVSVARTFVLAWHFPNFYAQRAAGDRTMTDHREGNAYTNHFRDAAAVARYVSAHLAALTARTRDFHDALHASTLPPAIIDQIASQLNTFIASSWYSERGEFGIMEGIVPDGDWGGLTTIDVALYGSFPVAALFPELDRAIVLTHAAIQAEHGQGSHSVPRHFGQLNLDDRQHGRVDITPDYVILALRHYFWTNDIGYLRAIWPSVTRGLDYVLRERDPDGDGIPDTEDATNNTSYDNFGMRGASSYVGSLWLAALDFAIRAAHDVGDGAASARYVKALEHAQGSFERLLWNGSYYNLYNDHASSEPIVDDGCLTDQLIGQWCEHWVGARDLIPPAHRQSVLRSIMRLSWEPGMGLRNCSWPGDGYLHDVPATWWYDQANTNWSGVELAFASLLIWEGMIPEAFAIIATVDARYRRNGRYFDHQEWGGHYLRPMAAWAILNALLGFSIDRGTYRFAPRYDQPTYTLFVSFPGGTAHYVHAPHHVEIRVLTGTLACDRLVIADTALGSAEVVLSDVRVAAGETLVAQAPSAPLAGHNSR